MTYTPNFTDSTDIFSAPSAPLCETIVLFFDHGFNGFNELVAGSNFIPFVAIIIRFISVIRGRFHYPCYPFHPCSFSHQIRFIRIIRVRFIQNPFHPHHPGPFELNNT